MKAGRVSLRARAQAEIKRRILDEVYAPGTMLSENQLADELSISRTPIREALRDLATGGLVDILPQRGVVVSALSLHDILEVYQLREQLECFAVEVATERMGARDAAAFQSDHAAAEAAMERGALREAYDHSVLLHGRIIAMAGNARLAAFMGQLSDQVHRFGLVTLRNGRVRTALAEHGGIIGAMVGGRGEAAAGLMRAHLLSEREMVMRLVMARAGTGLAAE